MHLRERAQNIGVESLICRQVNRLDAQKILHGTRYVVALDNFRGSRDGSFERLLRRFCVGVQANRNIGDKPHSLLGFVQYRAIALDHALALQVLHAPQASRRGKPDSVCQFKIGDAPIARQLTQYMIVNLV